MDIDVEVIIEECIEIIKAKEVDKFDTAVLKIREHGAHAYELLCLALKHADEFESMYLTHAVISIGEDILPHILKILPELGGVSKSYVIAALGDIKSGDIERAVDITVHNNYAHGGVADINPYYKILEKETGSLSGEGLKFGGEWADNLYDKQVADIVHNVTGAKVEKLDMRLPIEGGNELTNWKTDFGEQLKQEGIKRGENVFSNL